MRIECTCSNIASSRQSGVNFTLKQIINHKKCGCVNFNAHLKSQRNNYLNNYIYLLFMLGFILQVLHEDQNVYYDNNKLVTGTGFLPIWSTCPLT